MDESSEKSRRLSKRKRAALMMLPFILMLLCLGLLNMWARSVVETMPTPTRDRSEETAVSEPVEDDAEPVEAATQPAAMKSVTPEIKTTATDDTLPTLAPTAVPPPTTTPIPLPTLPPTATITLLGPPDQSRIMADDTITIYWTWPLPLAEDQFFGVYLQEESGDSRIGRLEEANFGSGYRWQTEAQYLTDDGGEVRYLIKLETILTNEPLITSESRTLHILNLDQ